MKIEFKLTKKGLTQLDEVYHLYINGKTFGAGFDLEGNQRTGATWKEQKKLMDMIMLIKCTDYPDDLELFNCPEYELPPGLVSAFAIKKDKRNMLFQIWFEVTGKYNKSNWPLNPYALKMKIYKHAQGIFLKKDDDDSDDYDNNIYAMFTYKTDLKGTIGDKFNMAFEALTQSVSKAEQEVVSEAKRYLKARK